MGACVVLGWREWVALPDLGLAAVRAKVDTGARSSALHVDWLEHYIDAGAPWVRFGLHPVDVSLPERSIQAPVLDRRQVTDSGGHVTERVFIATRVVLAGQAFLAEINLTSRHGMLFPMLLGRTALADRFVVDPAQSFVLGTTEASAT
ncbi:MAG: RimK/LysX family protein [Xanthomonadaceae bacterium]|nr:RimK/LysX family protein [Xanthomonadaceae bacterium]